MLFVIIELQRPFIKRLKSKYAVKGSLDNAAITQLVECLAVNQDVTGSSPVGGALVLNS